MKKLKKILLIDDSEATNAINTSLLKNLEIADQIITKNNGEDALLYLSKNNEDNFVIPDLIFLDLNMPTMGGFEFLEKYSSLDDKYTNQKGIVICILSDYINIENFTKSKEYKYSGVLCQIRKPIDKEDIEDLIEEHFYD